MNAEIPEPKGDEADETARVLLLDNDLFFVAKISATLRHAGYEVRTARDVAAFVRLLAEIHPAIALVNTAARGLDWRAAIALARGAYTPVIAFGSHVDIATQEAARAAGADRVIANSKLTGDLPAIVARTLRRRPLPPTPAKSTAERASADAAPGADPPR